MLDIFLAIWAFISQIVDIFNTIKDILIFATRFCFGIVGAVYTLLVSVFTGGLAWVFPVAGLSLGIGWLLLVLNRR